MKKKKVRILISVAGIGDPDFKKLDAQYALITERMTKMGASPKAIERVIEERKRVDGYDRGRTEMVVDYSFKPDDLVDLPEALALKWEQSGLCEILDGKKSAVA